MKLGHAVAFIQDLFAVLPTGIAEEWTQVPADTQRPTVILVSGFAATGRSLSVLRKRLMRDGYNVVIVALDWKTLSDGFRGLYRMAETLSTVVLRIKKRAGGSKAAVHLVAHSAGGLVARYYVQMLGGSHYCESLVTLATPHQGTWIAALGLVTHLALKARCLFQMTPFSPFIGRINRAELPPGFRLVSITSNADYLCPRFTTQLPLHWVENQNAVQIEVPDITHGAFLLSKVSYRLIKDNLFVQPNEKTAVPETKKTPLTRTL